MEISQDIYSWELHTRQLHLLLEQKKLTENTRDLSALNSNQILMTAILTESVICYVFICLVSRSGGLYPEGEEKSDFDTRIQDSLKRKIQKSSWGQLDEISQLLLGWKLKAVCAEKWESLGVLFNIRNMLSHGEFIKVVYQHSEFLSPLDAKSMEIHGKRRITDFLLSKKLIDLKFDRSAEEKIFSKKVANFFLAEAACYLRFFIEKAMEEPSRAECLMTRVKNEMDKLTEKLESNQFSQ